VHTSIKIQEFSFHYHKPRRKTEKINLYVIPFSRKFKELLACGSGELFSYRQYSEEFGLLLTRLIELNL